MEYPLFLPYSVSVVFWILVWLAYLIVMTLDINRSHILIQALITDIGLVLAAMPLMDIHKVDSKFWCPWEDVETERLTEQEGERLESIVLSEAGFFEVRTRDTSGDIMEIHGDFERPQIIDLITGKLPFDKLRSQAIHPIHYQERSH